MSEQNLTGLYCVNNAGVIGLVTGVEQSGNFTNYVGVTLDGLGWQSAAPLVIRPQNHMAYIHSALREGK